MAWCPQAPSHYLNQYWASFITLYGIAEGVFGDTYWYLNELGHHWLKWCLDACSAPSHYLNQCLFLVSLTLKNTIEQFYSEAKHFDWRKWKCCLLFGNHFVQTSVSLSYFLVVFNINKSCFGKCVIFIRQNVCQGYYQIIIHTLGWCVIAVCGSNSVLDCFTVFMHNPNGRQCVCC